MIKTHIPLDTCAKLPTVHVGQHDIAQDDVYLIVIQLFPGILPIYSRQHGEPFLKYLLHHKEQFGIIVNKQQCELVRVIGQNGTIFGVLFVRSR